MLKNMKLGVKIGGGFCLVLALTALVAFMGWNGLDKVTGRVGLSNDFHDILTGMLMTREDGKTFMITRDGKYVDLVAKDIDDLKQKTDAVKAKLSDPEKRKLVDDAVEGLNIFHKHFFEYVKLDKATNVLMIEWREQGENFTKITKGIMEDVIIPAQAEAKAKRDIDAAAQFTEISNNLATDITEKFLYLRTAAIYYLVVKTPQQWTNVQNAIRDLKEGIDKWGKTVRQINTLQDAGEKIAVNITRYEATANKFYETFSAQEKAGAEMTSAANKVQDICKKASDNQKTVMASEIATAENIIVWAAVIAFLMGTLVSIFLTFSIIRPVAEAVKLANAVAEGDLSMDISVDQEDEVGILVRSMRCMVGNLNEMVSCAKKIAEGDLTVKIKTLSENDLLGHALKDMVEKLSSIMSEINMSANNVSSGADQMSSTSQAMSQGATEQASSLEEISSSMNEIASQTKQNAENAGQANKLASEAKDFAEKGNAQMNDMVTAMKEINDSSQNISKIIKVIDEIAFQTNLLALNAAVEAARAGKHGKGFAVVAEEVRNLAARSAKAAKETAEMIEGSVKKVEGGTGIATQTAGALKEIVASVGKVTDLVAEIAAASNEQAQGVSQITQGLGQIDQVTQQNTAHAEESASAAEELSSQAMLLQQLVGTFKLSEDKVRVDADTAGHMDCQPVKNKKQMLTSGKPRSGNNGGKKSGWGGISDSEHETEPVIHLDDKEFGKY